MKERELSHGLDNLEYVNGNGEENDGNHTVRFKNTFVSEDYKDCGVNYLDICFLSECMGPALRGTVYV